MIPIAFMVVTYKFVIVNFVNLLEIEDPLRIMFGRLSKKIYKSMSARFTDISPRGMSSQNYL